MAESPMLRRLAAVRWAGMYPIEETITVSEDDMPVNLKSNLPVESARLPAWRAGTEIVAYGIRFPEVSVTNPLKCVCDDA